MADGTTQDPTRKQLRNFGLVMGTVLIGIGFYWLFYRDIYETARVVLLSVGGFLFVAGLVAPGTLKPVYTVWMKLALVLAWVNTRIIISLIFFLVITPIGIIIRLIKADLVHEKFQPDAPSYWTDTEEPPSVKEHCERQF
ncbi:MAG: SxtJ family membrane protein [Gemmatimonadota bacterium]|nr:SxtJ family membrane protein [Gemmatimonadota bacterium]